MVLGQYYGFLDGAKTSLPLRVTICCCISITHPLAEDPSYLLRLKLLDGLPAFPSNTFQVGRTRLPDLVYTTPLVLLLSLRLLGIMRFLLTVSLVRRRTRRASQDRGCMDICDAWRRAGCAAWCCVILSSRRFPPVSTQWDQPFCLRTLDPAYPTVFTRSGSNMLIISGRCISCNGNHCWTGGWVYCTFP